MNNRCSISADLTNAGSLPYYVTENYTWHSDKSNKDRIIVSFEPRWRRFTNVYVTQHSDQTNFDQNRTYRISTDLLKDIKELSREEFHRGRTTRSEHISISIPQSLKTTTCQSISNELMQDIQDLSLEEFHRGCTNRYPYLSQCSTARQTPVRVGNAAVRWLAVVCCYCSLLVLLYIFGWTQNSFNLLLFVVLANFENCSLLPLSQLLI